MLHQSFADSAGNFWWPEEFEKVANPYFNNLKHLQNPGHLLLTTSSILYSCDGIGTASANKTITEINSDNDQQPMDLVLTEV